jgi:beta-lactamase regulating signal transducer with metallopeptidase domain
MSDPSTYWLTVTNVVLGIVTAICCAAVVIGIFQELAERRKKAASLSKIDREVADLVSSFDDGHAFPLPELGLTMADGGEPTTKPLTKKEVK